MEKQIAIDHFGRWLFALQGIAMDVQHEIETVAEEMKAAASANPMDMSKMMVGIAAGHFPEVLSRLVTMNGKKWRVQFSHDQMPGDKGRVLAHLSFLNEEGTVPDEDSRKRFQCAFFGENSKICPNSNMILLGLAKLGENEVILIPSTRGPQVVQMGKML